MKVVQYQNYGKSIESTPNSKGIIDMQMFFSVYKLDNWKTICLQTIKYFNEEKNEFEWGEFSDGDKYDCCYLEHFKFGDDFYDWFYKIPKWTPETKWPNSNEEALVINLYENKIKVSEN